jgi:flavin reductase (DIM6/NTAB) family NADH-FMN oxidoreductase RutF
MEGCARFSLSFFGEEHRKALQTCGAISGRDGDKAAKAGLTPRSFETEAGEWTSFSEARLVLGCRKIHAQDLDPEGFIDPAIAPHYAEGDWHRMYVGAIEAAWLGD